MTKAQKVELVQYLTDEFKVADAIVVCDYKGLSVEQLEVLRNSAKSQDATVKVRVVKNTLAPIALKEAGIEGIELKDTNLIVWGNDQIAVSKVAFKFTEVAKENYSLKSAVVEGAKSDIKTIEALSALPGKDELIGMLLSVWTAPIRNFVTGLDNLKAKKEEEAA